MSKESMSCVICGNPLSIRELARRHHRSVAQIANREHCCSRHCEVKRRQQEGTYKGMSLVGKDTRSKAVTLSNSVNPRRKRHGGG